MKKVFLVLLALWLLLPLTSCHGSRSLEAFAVPETFDETKNYEITFWAKNDTNLTQVAIYEKAIEDFCALYPNIKVNLRLYTDYGRIYNDVITNMATFTTPNVCITYPDHIATYKTGTNTVVPLDGLMADEKYGLGGSEVRFDGPTAEEIVPQFLTEGVIDGEQYALPYMRSTEACYINKTYVEKLGYELPDVLTWDFIWEVSRAAAEQDEEGTYLVNGQKVMIPFIYKSTDNMMIQYLYQAGGEYSSEAGDILLFNDTTEALLETVAENTAAGAFSTFKISSYPANFLNAGQCVFAVDSTGGATWMGPDAPLIDIAEENLVDFEVAVRPIPQVDPENPKMISQGPSMCIFNKSDPGEVLASWLFMQFMLTNQVQIDYANTEGYVPVTTKAQQSEEYRDYLSRQGEDNEYYYTVKIEAAKLMLANVENTFVTPVFNGSASLRNAAGQMIEEVTKSIRRNQTVDAAYYEDLYADMNALYRLDQKTEAAAEKASFGALPGPAVMLLASLGLVWMGIGLYGAIGLVKKNRK